MNGFWKAQFREHVHGICAMLEAAAEPAKTKSLSRNSQAMSSGAYLLLNGAPAVALAPPVLPRNGRLCPHRSRMRIDYLQAPILSFHGSMLQGGRSTEVLSSSTRFVTAAEAPVRCSDKTTFSGSRGSPCKAEKPLPEVTATSPKFSYIIPVTDMPGFETLGLFAKEPPGTPSPAGPIPSPLTRFSRLSRRVRLRAQNRSRGR